MTVDDLVRVLSMFSEEGYGELQVAVAIEPGPFGETRDATVAEYPLGREAQRIVIRFDPP